MSFVYDNNYIILQASPQRFAFFKIQFDALQSGPTDQEIPLLHYQFNKNLPPEIIDHIASYLLPHDLINLAISKLFLPSLLTNKSFFCTLNIYFLHILCQYFKIHSQNFSILPIVFNKQCYLSIDVYRAQKFKLKTDNLLFGFQLILKKFSMLFQSFVTYQKFYAKYEDSFKNLWNTNCSNYTCSCKDFVYNLSSLTSAPLQMKRSSPLRYWIGPLEHDLTTNFNAYYREKNQEHTFCVISLISFLVSLVFLFYCIWQLTTELNNKS